MSTPVMAISEAAYEDGVEPANSKRLRIARDPTIPAKNVPMVRRLIAAPPFEIDLAAKL
jgi:hypothetical protein